MSQGEMPAGPNMGALTSMQQSAGSTAGAQMWLGGWVPVLDFKPGLTPITEVLPFFNKQMVPGAEAVKFLPTMPQGFLAKLLGEIFAGGFQLQDFAGDLSQEQIEALMQARSAGIEGGDAVAFVSQQASLKNVAINDVGGMGV